MSKQMVRPQSSALALHAFVAGIIGAILTDSFLSIAQHLSPINVWQYIASAAIGAVAYSSPSYAALGIVLHLVTALVWAYLYAYVAKELNLLHRWVFSGLIWGIVVTVVMDLLLAYRDVLGPLTLSSAIFGLITNVVFYGLPVAWYLARSVRAA
jgi:Na+-translocating ferredoxin:NAD+ oxidoreductase RnfE subunit